MTAYYSEHDPHAAQWLRNLIAAGHIAPGDVDERSIKDVHPDDLAGYTQCHFFAGIGVWSLALRRAGWDDSRPVWTGSCPCQPFSVAGRGDGTADERHLWPHWFHLISQRRPDVVFGEQVEAAIRHGWLDLVSTDLEGGGYAVGSAVVPVAGVGGPHARSRLWFVADAKAGGFRVDGSAPGESRHVAQREPANALGDAQLRGCDSDPVGRGISAGEEDRRVLKREGPTTGALAHSESERRGETGFRYRPGPEERPGRSDAWVDCDWIYCRDGKWRPVEPGTFPLAHGAPARVGRLRAYGNCISPQAAEEFIRAYLDVLEL